ncbi:hypothetical protein Q5P01_017872 [Channa striata]|uniref:Uncharacterized protein n=1 Tax=Channa striata TaxID=64152 RepID=A0AA88S885_CHASR|nr:hypothetical protein Q5P01_017872 [Channa striata]
MFGMSPGDAGRLSELLSDLTRARSPRDNGCPFADTPPYCTVQNVAHISGTVLEMLLAFDRDPELQPRELEGLLALTKTQAPIPLDPIEDPNDDFTDAENEQGDTDEEDEED